LASAIVNTPTSASSADHSNGHRANRFALHNLRPLIRGFSNDLAIDLGTVNTRVYVRGRGIVVNEPSAVAMNTVTHKLEAVGNEAWEMIGRTPTNIVVTRPIKNGVIADFKLAQAMVDFFIRKAHKRSALRRPRVVISIPSDITQVERRAVTDSAYRAKASEVHLVEQAMMAAVGAGMPVSKPGGNMIVDIGGGTTDVAVISLNGVVYSGSLPVAGNHMDEAIAEYVKSKHGLLIGERTAERIKMEIGSAYRLQKPRIMEATRGDFIENVPENFVLDDSEIRVALNESVSAIVTAIRAALERIPPELAGDISERGIVLAGGGASLQQLDQRIREETGVPVSIADDPTFCVALGAGKVLEDFQFLRRVEVA
jgi:rod shape-determining protein MreB and related proteins